MSHNKMQPVEVYVRHQSGPSALLTFHLNPDQRLKLIEALVTGQGIEMPAQLELSVLPQWLTNMGEDTPHAVIPLRVFSFNVDSTR